MDRALCMEGLSCWNRNCYLKYHSIEYDFPTNHYTIKQLQKKSVYIILGVFSHVKKIENWKNCHTEGSLTRKEIHHLTGNKTPVSISASLSLWVINNAFVCLLLVSCRPLSLMCLFCQDLTAYFQLFISIYDWQKMLSACRYSPRVRERRQKQNKVVASCHKERLRGAKRSEIKIRKKQIVGDIWLKPNQKVSFHRRGERKLWGCDWQSLMTLCCGIHKLES